MTDVEITKAEPPELQFAKERQEIINKNIEAATIGIERAERFDNPKDREEIIKSHREATVYIYFNMAFIKHYIYWNYRAYDDIITEEDMQNLFAVLPFSIRNESIQSFIHFVYTREQLGEIYKKYIDDPESAELPLSPNTEKLFTFYLDNVVKPAFLEIIDRSKRGVYRSIQTIMQELSEAFKVWYQNQTDDNQQAYKTLMSEQYKPRRDFLELIRQFGKDNGFFDLARSLFPESYSNDNKEILPVVNSTYPDNYIMNTTKLMRKINQADKFGEECGFDVSNSSKRKKKNEPTVVTLTLFPDKESNNITLSQPISLMDRAIIDAVETLGECNEYITPSQIYRILNGNNVSKVPEKSNENIESRLDVMRRIMATVDYTQHMNLNGYKGSYTSEGHLLELTKETVTLNGQTVLGYKKIARSPVYKYAKDVNQIISIPLKMLDTKAATNSNERTQNIKSYLLLRIYRIKEMSPTINMNKLLHEIGEPTPTKQQLQSIRNTVEDLLYYWSHGKAKGSNAAPNKEILDASPIINYSVNTKGKTITGYTVIPKTINV